MVAESNLDFQNIPVFENAIDEPDVGITSYLTKNPGFSGVLKQRYTDFLVNEITQDGAVLHLTNSEILKSDTQTESVLEVKPDEKDDKLRELIGEEALSKFLQWYQQGILSKEGLKNLSKRKKEAWEAREKERKEQTSNQATYLDNDEVIQEGDGAKETNEPEAALSKISEEKQKINDAFSKQKEEFKVEYDNLKMKLKETFAFPSGLSKENRTMIHKLIRNEWSDLSTDTTEGGSKAGTGTADDERVIVASFSGSNRTSIIYLVSILFARIRQLLPSICFVSVRIVSRYF